ncbi:MAG: hypothetical protein AAFY98_03040 [Verrucomicrobiota bacterium]
MWSLPVLALSSIPLYGGPYYTIKVSDPNPSEGDNISVEVIYEDNSAPNSVEIRALPGAAIPLDTAIPAPRFDDYDDGSVFPVSETFSSAGDSRSYGISITNDIFQEDDEDFYIQVFEPQKGVILEQVQIIIQTSDNGGSLQLIPDNPDRVPFPTREQAFGAIRVNMFEDSISPAPPGAGWRIVGETRWRSPGGTANDLPVTRFTGLSSGPTVPHEVEFLPVPGYDIQFAPTSFSTGSNTDPLASQVTIDDGGTTRLLSVSYTRNRSARGTLIVNLFPSSVQSAGTWRIRNLDEDSTPGDDAFPHSDKVNLPAGYYEIYFDPIGIFEPPRPRIVRVLPDVDNIIDATFLPSDSSGSNKFPLNPTDLFASSPGFDGPQATGQVRSNIAHTTGIAVASHTVLTSAQAVYNPERLAFSYKVRWMLQRQTAQNPNSAGANKTPTQIPKGYYIFNGYSDALSNTSLGTGEVDATRLDNGVAALFFDQPAARGGYAGYIGTDNAEIDTGLLDPDNFKFMASYGLSEDTRSPTTQDNDGDLHLSPINGLSSVLDFAGFNALFRTGALSNLKGSTKLAGVLGSPIFVRNPANEIDLPAGILVGTFDFGAGQRLIFRAFDEELIQLVHRANYSGQTTRTPAIWNNTSTSTTPISTLSFSALGGLGGGFGGSGGGGFGSESTTGDLVISLDPSGAVTAGARWGINSADEYESGEEVEGLLATDYTLSFASTTDYDDPTDDSATVVAEQTTRASKSYTASEELSWIQSQFSSGDWGDDSVVGPDANPDGDPYSNSLERAISGDPESSEDLLNLEASSGSLGITIEPDTSQTDMTITVYIGSDPSSLTTIGAQTNEGMTSWPTTARGVSVKDNGDGTYTIEDTNSGSARFMHIEATSSR